MPVFAYKALTANGSVTTGELDAADQPGADLPADMLEISEESLPAHPGAATDTRAAASLAADLHAALRERLPRPEAMKPDAYERNIAARAFDIARYLLFLGAPTGVGQVTSIRTLERQIRRMKASAYAALPTAKSSGRAQD